MLSGDLGRTAALALHDGADALEAVRLAVCHPIQPMLAASAADVGEALGDTGPASVEWKLDGARIQVHRAGRRGAHLHPQPQRHHRPPARRRGHRPSAAAGQSFVLDGEVLGVDEDAEPRAFQDTMSAFGRDDAVGAGDGLLVRFFDVLHVDGVDLIDEPLAAPARRLDALVGDLAVPRALHRPTRRAAQAFARRGARARATRA